MVFGLSTAPRPVPAQLPPSDQRRTIHHPLSQLPPSEEESSDDDEVPEDPSDDDKEELIKIEIEEFHAGFTNMESKMHRLPRSLQSLPRRYYVSPKAVAIGPYHRHSSRVKEMERVKMVATHYFCNGIFGSYTEMYDKFCSEMGGIDVRSLYVWGDDAVEGMSYDDLMSMMLCDGCFLLQYMLMCTTSREEMPQDHQQLACFFDANQAVINNDIMLLENQLPWVVIKTLRKFKEVPVLDFIAKMGRTLQVCRKGNEEIPFVLDDDRYTPPHLLALLRFYKMGSNITVANDGQDKRFSLINYCCYNNNSGDGPRPMSKTTSAIELAENGIKLTASRTMKFKDMGFKKKLFSGELFLAPLLLDGIRACWLLNMVAFELCTGTTSKNNTDIENQAVCSYLAIFAMLMDREDDVHQLRSKRLVQGELTNKEILGLFKSIMKCISGGPLYVHIMEEIEDYKLKRWMWIKVHKFVYHNYKTIAAVLSIIGVLVGIFKALFSLKQH